MIPRSEFEQASRLLYVRSTIDHGRRTVGTTFASDRGRLIHFAAFNRGVIIMSWIPKKCVVVPVDFSSASDKAIETALEITRRPEDVHVVHVALMPNFIPYAGEVIATVEPERWLQLAKTHLADYLKSRPPFQGVCSKVVEGDAGTRIAEFAAEHHADLIVMPSHGYHGVKRFLLGSVTESVLRHAPCEVLVLRRMD